MFLFNVKIMDAVKTKKKFKKCETGYHKSAVMILSDWTGGVPEKPFYVDDQIVFVPDVTVYKDGVIECVYEVVHSNPISSKKYGLMQYYCYRNFTSLTVYEISADFILSQTEKPERLKPMECYSINCLEYDEIQEELLTPIN